MKETDISFATFMNEEGWLIALIGLIPPAVFLVFVWAILS